MRDEIVSEKSETGKLSDLEVSETARKYFNEVIDRVPIDIKLIHGWHPTPFYSSKITREEIGQKIPEYEQVRKLEGKRIGEQPDAVGVRMLLNDTMTDHDPWHIIKEKDGTLKRPQYGTVAMDVFVLNDDGIYEFKERHIYTNDATPKNAYDMISNSVMGVPYGDVKFSVRLINSA